MINIGRDVYAEYQNGLLTLIDKGWWTPRSITLTESNVVHLIEYLKQEKFVTVDEPVLSKHIEDARLKDQQHHNRENY